MTTIRPPIDVEGIRVDLDRIGHYAGERLLSDDLQGDAAFESRMRGMHVRALHDTWGVALGFELYVEDNAVLTVGPGLAYDAWGREIVLTKETELTVPDELARDATKVWIVDLVCSYATTSDLRAAGAGREECDGRRIVDHARFRWSIVAPWFGQPVASDIQLGREIPLGRFVQWQKSLYATDLLERRNARPLLRPHVGAGTVDGAGLEWKPSVMTFGITAEVDTSAAGFSGVPMYFARLEDSPWADRPGDFGPFISIESPGPSSFGLTLAFGSGADDVAVMAGYAVFSWLGLEPYTGCPPDIGFVPVPIPISDVDEDLPT
ncbi:MAG TPA: hypothetical protein VFO05_07115 [Candidatus Limnocylindrales bacterium]|nr:hypothetical protein [Candidatus Limnocylindrales bacterium]